MGRRLPRNLGTAAHLSPGEWCRDPRVHVPGRMLAVHVACPDCGGVHEIASTHEIDAAGRVTPEFTCPTVTCAWAKWVELGGWREPAFDTSDAKP